MRRTYISLCLVFTVVLPTVALAATETPANRIPNAQNEQLAREALEERPDLTYVVFRPAVIFWQRLVAGTKNIFCELGELLAKRFPSLACTEIPTPPPPPPTPSPLRL